jgi:FkbM family methyltransferase
MMQNSSVPAAALKHLVPKPVVRFARQVNREWLMRYAVKSFSQEGEDILLKRVLFGRPDGFYVDVGAHHPVHFSNTFLFYRRGWRGINIDPTPGTKRLFERRRPKDITLELGISSERGVLPFWSFENAVLNTFDAAERDISLERGWKLREELSIPVERLDRVLEEHMPRGRGIDFMSIDVEGHEEGVIRSNDWDRFRPDVLCIEMLHVDIVNVQQQAVARFLKEKDYVLFAKLNNTLLFRERKFSVDG